MINKSMLMKKAWEIAKGKKMAIKFGLRLAWIEMRAAQKFDYLFNNLNKETIKSMAFSVFSAENNPAGAWWKECEKQGVEDSLKRYGYGIIKGAMEREERKMQWIMEKESKKEKMMLVELI